MNRYTEKLMRPLSSPRTPYEPQGLVNLLRRSEDMRRARSDPPRKVIEISSNGEWVRYKDVEELVKNAQEVARLLELGDRRLVAGDGPCGGQNAAAALTPKESAELYQACKKIAAEGVKDG